MMNVSVAASILPSGLPLPVSFGMIPLFAANPFTEPVGVIHYLIVGAVLFTAGLACMTLKRNALGILMGIELVLNGANINFVAFSHYLGDIHGQIFVFFILTVAAAESAIGLAILVLLFRNRASVQADELNALKG